MHAHLWASCIQGQPASRANQSAANPCSELNDLAASATPDMSVTEDAPTLEKLIRAVRRLRNGRTAGFDEIAPELLKYAEAPISQALHDLFSTVWSSGKVPAEWKEGIIVSLYKGKGSRSCCNSYRPISLLSVPGKVFAHVLLARTLTATARSEQASSTVRLHCWQVYSRCHTCSPVAI